MPSPQTGWLDVNGGDRFTFKLPATMRAQPAQAVDSLTGKYASDDCELVFDYGRYADPLDYKNYPNYREESTNISGVRAKLVSYRDIERADGLTYVLGVHFMDVGDGRTRLTIVMACRYAVDQHIGLEIFNSVRFR